MVWGTISSLGAFAESVGNMLNYYPLQFYYQLVVLPHGILSNTDFLPNKNVKKGGPVSSGINLELSNDFFAKNIPKTPQNRITAGTH